MLKIRLMGTENDIIWFRRIMRNHVQVEVLEVSELYTNKGTNKYYRTYMEIRKKDVKR